MRLIRVLCLGIPALLLAGCVIMNSDTLPSTAAAPAPREAAQPLRLNVHVALNCTPSCAVIGADAGQSGQAIIAAYGESGRFAVTPSDEVDFVAEIKLDVARQGDFLEAKICNGSFGLLPALWRDTLRMNTRLVSRLGMTSRHFEQQAEITYQCHLFLSPLVPFFGESDALDRTVTELARRTIAQAEAAGVWRTNPRQAAPSRLPAPPM